MNATSALIANSVSGFLIPRDAVNRLPAAEAGKDLKRGRKRGKSLDKLWSVVERLLSKQPLDPRHRRYRLAGD